MITLSGNIKKYHILSLKKGKDLYNEIVNYCKKNNIRNGIISAIGALQKVNLGYYNQKKQKYYTTLKNETVEIVNCTGNISIKDEEIFVHLHISVADKKLKVFGGHLMPESLVFACEVNILEFDNEPFIRKFSNETGLFLWSNK